MTYILLKNDVPKFVTNLIQNIKKQKIILLDGEIGTGKTFLAKEIAKQIGEKETITSPSFQIMNVYEKIVHIDAYNLKGNLEPYYDFFEDKIVIIEWYKNIDFKFEKYIKIKISYINENQRSYEVEEI
ncbi:MAG: tRNA (adenosine(37)-N6)-threonylcarbamoyltransferase complex ATPase subunit type 1 TsaE [Metamycoplasmataceae bacterium]